MGAFGVPLGCLLGAFWGAFGDLGGTLGYLWQTWESFGEALADLEAIWVPIWGEFGIPSRFGLKMRSGGLKRHTLDCSSRLWEDSACFLNIFWELCGNTCLKVCVRLLVITWGIFDVICRGLGLSLCLSRSASLSLSFSLSPSLF